MDAPLSQVPDPSHEPPNTPVDPVAAAVGQSVEEEDVNVGPILRMVGAVAVLIAIVIVSVFQIVNIEAQKAQAAAAVASGNPALREVEISAIRKLSQFDVVGEGRYQIPIDRAIDIMVDEARQQTNRTYSSEIDLSPGN
jgi:hypothetical protein